jgi:hypothetical protein
MCRSLPFRSPGVATRFAGIHAPGGAGVETPAAEVGSAAVGLAQYKEHVKERFEELDAAVAKLNRRLDELGR